MRVVNTDAKSHTSKNTGEVFTGGGNWEEADVPVGMSPEAPALLPLCRLGGWTAGGGGDGNLE